MPTLETPPNPAPATPPPAKQRVPAGRFGELDHSELVHLLDTLDDDRSRSRFRESIYISLLFYCVVGWFLLYGPRVLWHTPQVVPISQKEDKHELTTLDVPSDLAKVLPKSTPRPRTPPPAPTPQQKILEQPAPRAQAPPPPPKPAPKPLPATPQPQTPPQVAKPTPQPPIPAPAPTPAPQPPQPRPKPSQSIPDAPKPNPFSRPNFGGQQSAGDEIAQAARDAANARGSNATAAEGTDATAKHPGMSSGAEILSDTQGVDFGPYIKRLLQMVRASWIPLIPEETRPPLSKEGTTLIRFTIQKDGTLSYMHLDDSTHDDAINRAAWGGIKGVGQYPPLPADFKGQQLDLRIQFIIKQYRRGAE